MSRLLFAPTCQQLKPKPTGVSNRSAWAAPRNAGMTRSRSAKHHRRGAPSAFLRMQQAWRVFDLSMFIFSATDHQHARLSYAQGCLLLSCCDLPICCFPSTTGGGDFLRPLLKDISWQESAEFCAAAAAACSTNCQIDDILVRWLGVLNHCEYHEILECWRSFWLERACQYRC